MTFGLEQKPVIRKFVYDFVDFWGAGVMAANSNITYAVEIGMSPKESFEVMRSQLPLLEHISNELAYLRGDGKNKYDVYVDKRDEFLFSQFNHDVSGPAISCKK